MNHSYKNRDYTYITNQEQADEYEKDSTARGISIQLGGYNTGTKSSKYIDKLNNRGRTSLGSPSYFNTCKTPEEVIDVIIEKKIDLKPVIVNID